MYNKLFSRIVTSSIWLESTTTRFVWMTLLAVMDEDGHVHAASHENLASIARLRISDLRRAIHTLESKDPKSSDPEFEGRRIERVPGGWIVLNANKYRALASRAVAREKNKERAAKFREAKKERNACVTVRNGVSHESTPSDTDTDTDTVPPTPVGDVCDRVPEPKKESEVTEVMKRLRVLFTPSKPEKIWSRDELKALRELEPIPPDELELVEVQFARPEADFPECKTYCSGKLVTLLRNWSSQVKNARRWSAQLGNNQLQKW